MIFSIKSKSNSLPELFGLFPKSELLTLTSECKINPEKSQLVFDS